MVAFAGWKKHLTGHVLESRGLEFVYILFEILWLIIWVFSICQPVSSIFLICEIYFWRVYQFQINKFIFQINLIMSYIWI